MLLDLLGKHELIQPEDPGVAHLAGILRTPGDALRWVVSNIKYRPELRTDWWMPPGETLKGEGDCEDMAILLTSILESMGIPSKLGYGLAGAEFHVWSEADGRVLDPAMKNEFPATELLKNGYLKLATITKFGEFPALDPVVEVLIMPMSILEW